MGRVIQFPRAVIEPFRLEGQADMRVGMRAVRLMETGRQLGIVRRHRARQDSQHLQELERLLLRQFAQEEADAETLEETITVAQIVAPEILCQLELGERAVLVIAREDTGSGAAFGCASRGAVLAADSMAILPPRKSRLNQP